MDDEICMARAEHLLHQHPSVHIIDMLTRVA
jgi:hypothetical protein